MLKQHDLLRPEEAMTLEQRRAFMKLPLAERRRILSQLADVAADHYESEAGVQEREIWQDGDVVDY